MSRRALVESLAARHASVPTEAVLKEDLLRTGIAFDASALSDNLDGAVKPKSYFIFSFDQQPLAELGEAAVRRPPEEIALTGGPWELRRTIVSVRVNPESPYRVEGRSLMLEGSAIADVEFPPMPAYYRHALANGKTVMETAPTIQSGYLIYLTEHRLDGVEPARPGCAHDVQRDGAVRRELDRLVVGDAGHQGRRRLRGRGRRREADRREAR